MSSKFDKMTFGNKIKELRDSTGKNQSEFGAIFGVGQTTISNWEKGIREPDNIGITLEIANYFKISIDELVNDVRPNIYGDHQKNLIHFEDKPELLNLYNQIYESESLQLLFDSAKDLTPADLESVLIHIQGIRKARGLD